LRVQTGLKGLFVMFAEVASQLRRRANWLLSGQYDRIASEYYFPMPVHLDGSRLIVRSAAEATAMLRLQHAACVERGVVALQPTVTAVDLPRGNRFRIWVDWDEVSKLDPPPLKSTVVYYCRQTPGGFRIEMIDYLRLSTPELQPHYAALALSA
jgi:hypothetical protein